jgi:hypothetical protein
MRPVGISADTQTAKFPLSAGVIGSELVPVLAAVGAGAAEPTEGTIEVYREGDRPKKEKTASVLLTGSRRSGRHPHVHVGHP